MKAVIAGGGIGGMTAAICLARIGWQVEVLEQAPEIAEVGAGLQISPNGTRILEEIGVMPLLQDTLFQPEAIEMRIGATGRQIFRLPIKEAARDRWDAPYIQIHRADLLAALEARLRDFPDATVRINSTVSGYQHDDHGVTAILTDGTHVQADLLIGADGIHSAVRTAMLGPDLPRFTGNVAWRAVVAADALGPLAPPPTGCIWAGAGKHAVTTRIRAGKLVNFVGIVETDRWDGEGWSIEGNKEDALADFGDWSAMFTAIITQTPRLFRWALCDRAPLARWSDGPVTLLGDAAHPMLPMMAQGAVQAIEDGFVLALELAKETSVARACQHYFEARIKRATRIQATSAANARLFHRHSAAAQLASYGPIWLAGKLMPRVLLARNDWIYDARFG